jgi:hypothetical protein
MRERKRCSSALAMCASLTKALARAGSSSSVAWLKQSSRSSKPADGGARATARRAWPPTRARRARRDHRSEVHAQPPSPPGSARAAVPDLAMSPPAPTGRSPTGQSSWPLVVGRPDREMVELAWHALSRPCWCKATSPCHRARRARTGAWLADQAAVRRRRAEHGRGARPLPASRPAATEPSTEDQMRWPLTVASDGSTFQVKSDGR